MLIVIFFCAQNWFVLHDDFSPAETNKTLQLLMLDTIIPPICKVIDQYVEVITNENCIDLTEVTVTKVILDNVINDTCQWVCYKLIM